MKTRLAVMVLAAVCVIGYGVHQAYRAMSGELSDEQKAVQAMLAFYDANDYTALYLHCDSAWKRRFNPQQSLLEFEHWRKITGPVEVISLQSARSSNDHGDQRSQLVYRCEANHGGTVRLYLTLHHEPDWKIAEFSFR